MKIRCSHFETTLGNDWFLLKRSLKFSKYNFKRKIDLWRFRKYIFLLSLDVIWTDAECLGKAVQNSRGLSSECFGSLDLTSSVKVYDMKESNAWERWTLRLSKFTTFWTLVSSISQLRRKSIRFCAMSWTFTSVSSTFSHIFRADCKIILHYYQSSSEKQSIYQVNSQSTVHGQPRKSAEQETPAQTSVDKSLLEQDYFEIREPDESLELRDQFCNEIQFKLSRARRWLVFRALKCALKESVANQHCKMPCPSKSMRKQIYSWVFFHQIRWTF